VERCQLTVEGNPWAEEARSARLLRDRGRSAGEASPRQIRRGSGAP
jgi:hypothetical protein